MEKNIKKSFILLVILVVLVFMGVIDFIRTTQSFEQPIFARIKVDQKKDGGSATYLGLGYRTKLEGNFMPEDELSGVSHVRFYVLGLKVSDTLRD